MIDGGNRFIVVSSGGLRLAFPMNFVLKVDQWRRPEPLPGAMDWIMGIHPGESTVNPVVLQSFWGKEDAPPEVCLLLDFKGIRLGIPGSTPAVIDGSPKRIENRENLNDCLDWFIMEGSNEAWCVNVPCLYRTLNLEYNTADNIGGLDA